MHKAMKGDLRFIAPDLVSLLHTQEGGPHVRPPQAPTPAACWLGSAMGGTQQIRGRQKSRTGHLPSSLPAGLLVAVFLSQKAWLLSGCTLSCFPNLSISSPFKLRDNAGFLLLPRQGFHHSSLASLNFTHTILKTPFLKLSLVPPFQCAICFLPESLASTPIMTNS